MADILPVALLVVLELAFLATGLTLCLVGKRLIERSREARFEGEGSIANTSFKIATSSPGLVFLVAGLALIAVALFRQSEVQDAYRELAPARTVQQPAPTAAVAPAAPVPPASAPAAPEAPSPAAPALAPTQSLQTLVERVRTVRFAAGDGATRSVDSDLAQARRFAEEGRVDDAAVHLAAAVVAEPATLKTIVSDAAFRGVVQHPQFDAIARARLQLPLNTVSVPTGTLSPLAERVVARLQMWATLRGPQDVDARARPIADVLPNKRGAEPKAQTVRTLVDLVERSPGALARELSSPGRRWILDDPELLRVLEEDIDRRIRND